MSTINYAVHQTANKTHKKRYDSVHGKQWNFVKNDKHASNMVI
jgi:hypothetical protein